MKQEDKELLLKDLCARLPYGVKLQNVNNAESIVKLRSIDLDGYCYKILFYSYQGKALTICNESKLFRFGNILRYKPYLFPLSSITEEQQEEFDRIYADDMQVVACNLKNRLDGKPYERNLGHYRHIDWLNANHFDYRGLIPKGLAIDATGLNIY